MLALGDAVRALKRVGLEADARRLALEALLARVAARGRQLTMQDAHDAPTDGRQRQHLEAFLEMLAAERGAAANTLQAYRRDLDDFLAFLERRAASRSRAPSPPISAPICARCRKRAWRPPRARAGCRRCASCSSSWSAKAIVAEDPAHGLAGPKAGRPLPKTLSVAEVDRLIEAARRRTETTKGPRARARAAPACADRDALRHRPARDASW